MAEVSLGPRSPRRAGTLVGRGEILVTEWESEAR